MSRLHKLAAREHAAYEAAQAASLAAVTCALDGGRDTDEHYALQRRAGALRAQWLSAARLLEEAESRHYAREAVTS